MNIQIKKSVNPVKYKDAIDLLERRLKLVSENQDKELIWVLEHEPIFTGGSSYSKNDILAAKNAGIDSIGLSYGYNYNENIQDYNPELVVDNFQYLQKLD